jgi:hypothetical protein
VGQAGVSGNGSGFTSGNPNAPQGSQVAFVQTTGSISQAVTLNAGSYTLSFSAAQRATYQSSSQTFQVLIDGVAVGSFTPASTSYATLTTSVFTLTAGVHTIGFAGLNPHGGDNTAFIDQVNLGGPPPPPPPQLQDPGFEIPALGSGASAFQYDPAASPWTFVGQAGISGNGSGFTSGNPNAPQGSQVAFLEYTGGFNQAVTLNAGLYSISFSASQRATYQSSSQTFQVLVDGVAMGSFMPSGTAYANFTTSPFTLAAGIHTIAFVGLNPNGGDNTAFVDQVSLNGPCRRHRRNCKTQGLNCRRLALVPRRSNMIRRVLPGPSWAKLAFPATTAASRPAIPTLPRVARSPCWSTPAVSARR